MSESITAVDINFSNGGAGHSANITCVRNSKNPDGTPTLGSVEGKLGKRSSFSEKKIDDLLKNFVLVETTVKRGSINTNVARKYTDKTSLALSSYVVLVRGVNATPREAINELDQNGNPKLIDIPYFSEVVNSPKMSNFPFAVLGPKQYKSVIIAGRIYNYESAADPRGIKISLVYNNGELQEELSLNDEWVNNAYKYSDGGFPNFGTGPDLSQYDLKFGYTADDFLTMLSMANIRQEGFPSVKDVVFETSGTLASVVSSVASYLGLHWYINPFDGSIKFINSQKAKTIIIEDPTTKDDENIVDASFTESHLSNTTVNVYSGSEEKKDDKAPKDDDRPRPCFFKRVLIEELLPFVKKDLINPAADDERILNRTELGTFFTIFNQGCTEEQFNKLCFLSMCCDWGKDGNNKQIPFQKYNPLYKQMPACTELKHFVHPPPPFIGPHVFFADLGGEQHRESALPPPLELEIKKEKWDRINHKFKYYELQAINAEKPRVGQIIDDLEVRPMDDPENLFDFLSAYFQAAGGIFVSNGYSEYKSNRMAWNNTNNITILGPYRYDTEIRKIDELSMLNDIFSKLKITGWERDPATGKPLEDDGIPSTPRPMRIEDLAETSNGEAVCVPRQTLGGPPVNKFHFVAIRQFPKLEKDNGKGLDEWDDFDWLDEQVEIVEFQGLGKRRYIGGPTQGPNTAPNFVEKTKSLVVSSIHKYDAAMLNTNKRRLKLTYTRSKTEVNKINEEGEVAEDNAISSGSDSAQKISDLFDRYDSKSFVIQAPEHDITKSVSLVTTNGSTTEISAMSKARGDFGITDEEDNLKSSTTTFYGLHIPEFKPTTSSLSFSVGPNGISTTVGESSLNLIPPDQDYLMTNGMEALRLDVSARKFNASQRNYFGL